MVKCSVRMRPSTLVFAVLRDWCDGGIRVPKRNDRTCLGLGLCKLFATDLGESVGEMAGF